MRSPTGEAWWRWWELKSALAYPKTNYSSSCRGRMRPRLPDASGSRRQGKAQEETNSRYKTETRIEATYPGRGGVLILPGAER
jgi:hypothetical protein